MQMKKTKSKYTMWAGLFFILFGCGSAPSPTPVESDYTRTPIVFVHGRLVENTYFDPMLEYLEIRGWPKEYLYKVDYTSKDMPNVLAAESQLAPEIEALLKSAQQACTQNSDKCPTFDKVDIVAHSMGAVSTRWYTAMMRPDRVRTWIALAGANHGSAKNCPGPENSGKRDLCPAKAETAEINPVQFALNGSPLPDVDESPYGIGKDTKGVNRIEPDEARRILYLTVRVKNDEFVSPPESLILDGTGGVELNLPKRVKFKETSTGNYLVKKKIGHDALPMFYMTAIFVEFALLAER